MKRLLLLGMMLVLPTLILHAEVTIPVSSSFTGNDGTCLARLYNEVLIPANWAGTAYGNPNAATQFARSNSGTLGLTIFFEVRPNTDPNGVPFSAAMSGIGFTAVNRFHTSGFLNRNLTTLNAITKLKAITKNMSNVWSKNSSNQYDGTADLVSADSALLSTILAGASNSQNCAGLIWSFEMAQSVLYFTDTGYDEGHNVYRTQVQSYFPKTLWFRSSSGSPSGNAYLIKSLQIPSCGGVGTFYFWGQNGVKWTGTAW